MKQITRLICIFTVICINSSIINAKEIVYSKDAITMIFVNNYEMKADECRLDTVYSSPYWSSTGDLVINTSKTLVIPETITDSNTSKKYKVTSIKPGSLFTYCYSYINTIVIPSGVSCIPEKLFSGFIDLTTVEFKGGLKEIGEDAFSRCTSLKYVYFNDSPMERIGNGAFVGCRSLNSICIKGHNLKIGGGVFNECSNLTKVELLGSVKAIEDGAFYMCSNLTDVTISGSNIQYGSSIWAYCSKLKKIKLCGEVIRTDPLKYRMINQKDSISEIEFLEGVKTIKDSVFYTISSFFHPTMNNLNIPSTLEDWGPLYVTNRWDLYSISVSDKNTKYDSRNKCNAIIEKENNKLVFGCKNTVIPNSVRCIGKCAFAYTGTGGVKQLPERLNSIEDSAFYSSGLTSVEIPEMVSIIGLNAFSYNNLNAINVAEGNETYDSRNNCNAIIETKTNTLICGCKNTVIPKDVQYINEFAFNGCSLLESIVLPDKLEGIGSMAFNNCSGLTTIIIPQGIKSIGEKAFYNCTGLTSITCTMTNPIDIDESVFMLSNSSKQYDIYDNVTLYVPKGTKRKYWDAAGWSRFENIVEMEENLKGDVNGDMVVDVADIASIISVMAGQSDTTLEKSADVNGDGTVDVADIAAVITRMAELARQKQTIAEGK